MIVKLVGVLAAGVISCLLLAWGHAYRWERIFGRPVKPPWAYVAGVLLLGLPFAGLMALWGDWWALAAAAAVVIGGGCPVLFGYGIRGEVEAAITKEADKVAELYRRRLAELEREWLSRVGDGEEDAGA